MNRLQTILTVVAVAILCSTGLAHATMIDVTLGNTGSDSSFSSGSNTLTPNLNLSTLGSELVLNNNSQIITPPGSVLNQYTKPSGTLYGNNFLSVFGIPSTGMATFTLGAGLNAFAFTWGTLDAYNTLILKDSRNVTYTFTGADILNRIPSSVAGTTQSDVSFFDPFGSILKAQLISTNNAFEAANFSATDPSPVPLPSTLPLFGAALIGLALFVRRKDSRLFSQAG